jgi:hypothetical protein
VVGGAGGEARFTVTDGRIEGVVITPAENYYLQPMRDFEEAAAPAEFVLYRGSDVNPGAVGDCGALTLERKVAQATEQFAAPATATVAPDPLAATTLREVEVATEADYEYVQALGGSSAADSEILSILNQVEGVYGSELGISFKVVYQHTWATSADPYSATEPNAMLAEFASYWNANFGNVGRDLAHMWTGRDMDGSAIGIAYIGVTCRSASYAYGISERQTGAVAKVGVTAHEVGHNFNAAHATECPDTIMYPSLGGSTQLTFCQTSRDQISSYVSSYGGCLSGVTATPTPTPTPTPTATPTPTITPTPSPTPAQPPSYEGYHDVADCSAIAGWAWDQNRPNTTINLDVYADGALLTTVPAGQFRQDLLDAGKGNGYHGFALATPAALIDGWAHSVWVRYAGTGLDLYNTPKTITGGALGSAAPYSGGAAWAAGLGYATGEVAPEQSAAAAGGGDWLFDAYAGGTPRTAFDLVRYFALRPAGR